MPTDYVPILVMIVIATGFAGVAIGASALLGPRQRTPRKGEPYECGIKVTSPARRRLPVKFYLVAMLFILFDVEAAFFYPWAVVQRQLKLFGFLEMAVFIALLLVAYVYVWKKGGFEWD